MYYTIFRNTFYRELRGVANPGTHHHYNVIINTAILMNAIAREPRSVFGRTLYYVRVREYIPSSIDTHTHTRAPSHRWSFKVFFYYHRARSFPHVMLCVCHSAIPIRLEDVAHKLIVYGQTHYAFGRRANVEAAANTRISGKCALSLSCV